MTRFRLLLLLVALIPLAGCTSLKEWMERDRQKGTGELQKVQPEQLTAYINDQASRMQSLSADVRVAPYSEGFRLPTTLTGNLAASQPRNFRMTAGAMAAKVDLGSNDDQFWVYVTGAGAGPMYVFASHTDFKDGKVKIPGNIPFEPDWVMQALGMMPLPPGNQYSAPPPDQKNRTYTLSWPAVTPNGTSIVKEIVFDGDDATIGNKPQVKKHIVRNAQNKVICSAEIKSVKTVQLTTTNPRTGLPLTVQYPTRVVLKWEEQKFEMDLELSGGKVNEPLAPGSTAFVRPNISGTTAVDLADHRERPR
jgi:hypothetical protein